MARYMLLHCGFEPPTPEMMQAWERWFESVADRTVQHGGFAGGVEVSHDGTTPLPFGPGSMTGYSIINAANLDEAQSIARENPFVDAIRVYEIREHE
ncbi:MAG: hypothetical protein R3E86_05495 [Pseudomonadales bacterium]